ncbi:MAG: Trm112 family protein [Pseudomonadota bacterium]
MPGPETLLDILCCPVSHEPLRPLGKARLSRLNEAIAQSSVQYVDGSAVEDVLKAALITRDSKVIYAIVDAIPVLLPDRGIGTAQLNLDTF